MKFVRILSALVVLSVPAISPGHAAPRQPPPKVPPKPGSSGLPGVSAAQRGSIGGAVTRPSGVNGTGVSKPH